MAKSYEELVGSLGRAVYFRPERRRVRELLSRDADPAVDVAGKRYRLFDISLNGVSFTASPPDAEAFPVGREMEIGVLVHNAPLFFGKARVARREPAPGGVRLGLALVNGLLDLPDFLRRDEENRLERELNGGPENLRRLVPPEYLALMERGASFLSYYKASLARHEARYKAQATGGAEDAERLAHRALEALRDRWSAFDREASEMAMSFIGDAATLQAAKRYTETLITPFWLDSPMPRRAYLKPRGYPGDFQIMQYYYDNRLEGDYAFARVLHKFGVEHPLSNGCRTRKDYTIEKIATEVRRSAASRGNEPFYATSLGCGPAREVQDFALTQKEWPGHVHWTLIDQEEDALSVAYQTGTRALSSVKGEGVLECMHISFSQLLADPSLFPSKHHHHFIYSVGLFDYLRENKAQELVAALYERVAPGGLLLIGTAKGPNTHFWSAEFMMDWTLLYRTEEEMRRMAAKLPPKAEVSVELEPGKAYYFLVVRKP